MNESSLSDRLNENCFCRRTDDESLSRVLAGANDGLLSRSQVASPGLFSDAAVYLPRAAINRMEATARAIENVAQLPAYRAQVFSYAPEIALREFGPTGVFMGYDFHVVGDDPRLIEVNTNAGGALINSALAAAQQACCIDAGATAQPPLQGRFDDAVVRMFLSEWSKQGRAGRPKRVAIVDDDPPSQYLYSDMVLAQRVLNDQGIETIIADAGELMFEREILSHRGLPVDLVYNRLTDFALNMTDHGSLRAAYRTGAAVVTPNPWSHALFADKRNLAFLSDPEQLRPLQVSELDTEILAATIPMTVVVTSENASDLWTDRRHLFFKPATGFGSKAAYRGDKVTRSVWSHILKGNYVAQSFTPPGVRTIKVEGAKSTLKADIRLFRYEGETLLFAARLYQGQTTNFRTAGGGFAPVFVAD